MLEMFIIGNKGAFCRPIHFVAMKTNFNAVRNRSYHHIDGDNRRSQSTNAVSPVAVHHPNPKLHSTHATLDGGCVCARESVRINAPCLNVYVGECAWGIREAYHVSHTARNHNNNKFESRTVV